MKDTTEKALKINTDNITYGTFAEIGAGQEVARIFFRAGGASGTVAKTISAYDKEFSDWMYGKGKNERYVSKPRLERMLNREFDILSEVLTYRKKNTCFFVFADTVSTITYQKDNESHGWLGVKFQLHPESLPNQVIMHVRLHENEKLLQQASIGILGVNLIYACFHYYNQPVTFLKSLLDNLSTDRVEINMIEMSGPELSYIDNRLLSVQLVSNGLTDVALFDRHGKVQQPSDMLYKKNVMVLRGSFRPITYAGFDMLRAGFAMFKKDSDYHKEDNIILCEMTLNNLLAEGNFDERDFLARADILCGMGQNVMISNFKEYYKLVQYLSQFNIKQLRLIIGILTLRNVLDERYYNELKGGLLHALGLLFPDNMKIYVYPALQTGSKELLTTSNLPIPTDIEYLFRHLTFSGKIVDIKDIRKQYLSFFSNQVLSLIHNNDKNWLEMVPKYVSEKIIANKLFGYSEIN